MALIPCPRCRKEVSSDAPDCIYCRTPINAAARVLAPTFAPSPGPAPLLSVGPQRVTVTDFDVSFGNLVMLFVKAALAAIPALIILTVIWAAILFTLSFLVLRSIGPLGGSPLLRP